MKFHGKSVFFCITSLLLSVWTTGCIVSYTELSKSGKYFEAASQCEKLNSDARKDCYHNVADTAFESQDYDTALRYYRKLGIDSGIEKVKSEYVLKVRESLNAGDLESAAKYYSKFKEKILFEDYFDDNRNEWALKDDEEIRLNIKDGKYVFSRKKKAGNWLSWKNHFNIIDRDQDFAIEAVFTKATGPDDSSNGIFFGIKDANNGLFFKIKGNGQFTFLKSYEGKTTNIIENEKSPYINPGTGANKLRVQRTGREFHFYVNGHFVGKADEEVLPGNGIGFSAGGDSKVEIDDVIVSQFPVEPAIYTELAEMEVAKGNDEIASQLIIKGGFTKAQADLRLAQTKFNQGDDAACRSYIERAGWSITDIRRSILFEENFNDNKNHWFEGVDEKVHMEITGGFYIFKDKNPELDYGTWPQNWNESLINSSADFKLEATITKEGGADDGSYDLLWGLKDINNFNSFSIAGVGQYSCDKKVGGKWFSIVPWSSSEFIRKGNATNVLSIVKSGDKLNFYINDHLVNTARYRTPEGNKIGFFLNRDIQVKIDRVVLTYFPPEIAMTLAAKIVEISGDKKELKKLAGVFVAKKSYDKAWEYYGKVLDPADVAPAFLRTLLEEEKRASVAEIAVDKLNRKGVVSTLKQILNHKAADVNSVAFEAIYRVKEGN